MAITLRNIKGSPLTHDEMDENFSALTSSLGAGDGLTGGGFLTSEVEFNVGQGDGITVNPDSVQVNATVARTGSNVFTGPQDIQSALTASSALLGGFTYPTTDSIYGYVLATDGAGNLFFQQATSGSITSSGAVFPFTGSAGFLGNVDIDGNLTVDGNLDITGTFTAPSASFGSVNFTSSVITQLSASYIDLDVLANGDIPAHRAGRIFFGAEDGALQVYNEEADITLQVGQEFWVRVFNDTDDDILNGTPVRVSGSQGDRLKIYPAVAEDHVDVLDFDNHILGVATHTIEASSEGYITSQGIVRGVDTSAFAAGDILYLQTGSAGFRNDPPPFPYDIVQVGYVARSASPNGFVYVEPKEPIHFHDISGLSGSLVVDDGALWVYESSSRAWINSNTLPDITASGSFSGSYVGSDITVTSASFNRLDVSGNSTLDGNLTVTGIVTAEEFHTEFVSASIIYRSGSTKFGDTSDDIHEFTGSVEVLGDTIFTGDITGSSNLDIAGTIDANVYSINGTTVVDSSRNITGSAGTFSGAVDVASLDSTGNVDANTFSIDGSTVIDASENITGASLDVTGEVQGNSVSIDGFTVIDSSVNITGSTLDMSGNIDGNSYSVNGTSIVTSGRVIDNITQANVDNLRLDGNTLSNTATDQNVVIEATGTGILDVNVGSNFQDLVTIQGDLYPETNYVSNIGAINKKFLTLSVAELIVETLVASERRTTVGGRFNVGIGTQLSQSLSSGDTTIIVENNNLNPNDIIHLEGGVLPKVEFMKVTSTASSGSGDGFSYTVIRDLDGTGANDWDAGSGVFNTGAPGNGFIDQYAINSLRSGSGISTAGPTIAFMERTGSAYQDIDIRAGVGNLKGWYGYSTEIFGFAAGDYRGQNITVDPENGLRIRDINTLQFQASGSTLTIGDNFIFNSGTGLLQVSGSNVQLETPTFFLGDSSQFISGSNGNLRVESTNFTIAQNGDVTMTGTITAEAGQIGGFAITDSAITGSGFFLSGSATGNEFFISSSKFNVKANGDVTASNATIVGDITATNITAINQGNIAGFTLTSDQLVDSNTGTSLVLKSNGQITGSNVLFTGGKISGSAIEFDVTNFVAKGDTVEISGSNFHLLNGNITASNVDLSGNINAETGTIGGFDITADALSSSNFFLSGSATGNEFFISASSFNVRANGDVTASNADISGRIVAESGTIGGFNIGSNLSNSAGSTLILKGATGQITASAAQITGNITATSGQIAGFTISGDTIVGNAYTIDASADANGEYFISSSEVKIEGNGDATFGEYSFQLLNDAVGLNGLRRESSLTNINVLKGTDANGHGGLLGIAAAGDIYLAPISSSLLTGGGWDSFTRELRYSLANDRWEIEQELYVSGDVNVTGAISGSSLDSSGNTTIRGNLTVLGDTTISGDVDGHITVTPVASDSDNSNGVVVQDLSFDEFGHTQTLATVDLDGRYLRLSGGTLTGNVSSNSQIISTKGTIGFSNLANAGFLAGTTSNGIGIDPNEIRSKGTDLYIGTIDANKIDFGTGGVNSQVVIASGGKVGIGTDTPSAELDVEGSIQIKEANLSFQNNADVDIGTEVIATVAIASFDAAFFDFVVKKTTNLRAGTVYAIHDGTNVEFTETSTQDLGDTSDVTLSVDISGGNLRLLATTTSNDWSVKALVRGL